MIEALFKEIPIAGAIVFVVVMFIRFLKAENARRDEMEEKRTEIYKQIGDTCHKHTRELNEKASAAIEKSSAAIEENTKALGGIAELMRGCADKVNGR